MDTEANKEFAKSAHPLNWYEVAKLMHDNAHTLHSIEQGYVSYSNGDKVVTRKTSNRSVFLLAAFALENLLKAYLIYENPQYIEGGKLSKKLLNGHSLSKLHQSCRKIPSPKRTLQIFQTLEVGVNSWARYPCATSIDRESDERSITPELWHEYNRVFNLYSRKLEIMLSKNWKDPYGHTTYVTFT